MKLEDKVESIKRKLSDIDAKVKRTEVINKLKHADINYFLICVYILLVLCFIPMKFFLKVVISFTVVISFFGINLYVKKLKKNKKTKQIREIDEEIKKYIPSFNNDMRESLIKYKLKKQLVLNIIKQEGDYFFPFNSKNEIKEEFVNDKIIFLDIAERSFFIEANNSYGSSYVIIKKDNIDYDFLLKKFKEHIENSSVNSMGDISLIIKSFYRELDLQNMINNEKPNISIKSKI